MFKEFSDKKNDILILQRNIVFAIVIILIITNLILSISIIRKDQKVILVPFGLNNKVTLSTNRPHNSYLEAVSRDIIYTILNLTPNNVDYAEKTILSFAHGSSYGKLKNQMEELKKNIVSKKFSTVFYPVAIYPDSSTLTVVIDGVLYTYFGQKEVSREKKKYEIKYNYTAGRLSIIGFSGVVEENK